MSGKSHYALFVLCLALIVLSVTSLSICAQRDSEKYGAGTAGDTCDEDCSLLVMIDDECYHKTENDACLTDACIQNNFYGAECTPNANVCTNCAVEWDATGITWEQSSKKNMTCSTADNSTGGKPWNVAFGECQYGNTGTWGRCFISYCLGDDWEDWITRIHGVWECEV